ncbi:DUF418 domain-containing protein [Cellulomonas cellasea]|uniref:Putative membrane protein YeiB n=1 Tax=Cellulomonas cellasea TaxID=43670 RepID=A0A7W4UGF5_9CELL|nr:DUF418 domain-containing protein [Cellulomonas cellasea]MBB2923721.1 putative membrane protein YeiB [Cellulomonas cellasea]
MSHLPTADASVAPRSLPAPELAAPAPDPGPVARSVAPDLARGMLLLFIASANVWGYLWSDAGWLDAGGRPAGGSSLDHLVDGVVAFVVDSRSKPMFAILYGFGLATMAARLAARGADRRTTRGVLARRSGVLIALGLAHAALLFAGDILAPYGATGLVALAFVHRSRATLVRWFVVAYVLSMTAGAIAVLGAFDSSSGAGDDPGAAAAVADPATLGYLATVGERLVTVATATSLFTVSLMFVPHVVVGILLARAGWLTRPAEHRRRLGQVAVAAGVVNVVGGLPYALAVAQVWHPGGTTLGVAELVHHVAGDVMGLGYVCLFGWLAAVWGERARGGVLSAVAATGERSLTAYLLQSVMFAPLLSAWGLGLGGRIGTAQAAVLAVGVWLVTVLVAVALHRAGRRGPFEVLVRRLAYGRTGAAGSVPVTRVGTRRGAVPADGSTTTG